jgi:hypothetical protein
MKGAHARRSSFWKQRFKHLGGVCLQTQCGMRNQAQPGWAENPPIRPTLLRLPS